MQLSFHSLLASEKEVDFFTEVILDTGLAGDLEHSTLATLETIPEEVLLEEEETARELQLDIDAAYDADNLRYEYYVVISDDLLESQEEVWGGENFFCGTWEECTAFVTTYRKRGHRFDAHFYKNGDDRVLASVQFFKSGLTLTTPRRY